MSKRETIDFSIALTDEKQNLLIKFFNQYPAGKYYTQKQREKKRLPAYIVDGTELEFLQSINVDIDDPRHFFVANNQTWQDEESETKRKLVLKEIRLNDDNIAIQEPIVPEPAQTLQIKITTLEVPARLGMENLRNEIYRQAGEAKRNSIIYGKGFLLFSGATNRSDVLVKNEDGFFTVKIKQVIPFFEGSELAVNEVNAANLANTLQEMVYGLQIIHQKGYVHFDLKTGNGIKNKKRTVWIDLGLTDKPKKAHTICGNPRTMAPEILKPDCITGYPVDIYSLGCIFYCILTKDENYIHEEHREVLQTLLGLSVITLEDLADVHYFCLDELPFCEEYDLTDNKKGKLIQLIKQMLDEEQSNRITLDEVNNKLENIFSVKPEHESEYKSKSESMIMEYCPML